MSKYGRRRLEAALVEHGLALIDAAVLSALADFGARSQQQLADALDFDKSHLVGRIDRLASRGLLTRTQDRADRRRNQVQLTAAGTALAERLTRTGEESQEGFLDVLSTAEQETLVALLRRVLAAHDDARARQAERPPRPGG